MAKTKKKVERMGNDPLAHVRSTVEDAPTPTVKRDPGRPRTNYRVITSKAQQGVPEGWTRYTLIVREEHLLFLKEAAYWNRKKIKDVVDEAIEDYFRKHRKRLDETIKKDATKDVP